MTVTPLRPEVSVSPTKQQFLDYVALTYDSWVEAYGAEPEGIVYGFGDYQGNASGHWLIPNKEAGNICKMLVISIAHEIDKAVTEP